VAASKNSPLTPATGFDKREGLRRVDRKRSLRQASDGHLGDDHEKLSLDRPQGRR